jgi:hypothetical protein
MMALSNVSENNKVTWRPLRDEIFMAVWHDYEALGVFVRIRKQERE